MADKDKKPVPKKGEVTKESQTKILSSLGGIFSSVLSQMPVATPDFFTRHAGKSFWDIAEEMMADAHIQSVFRSRRAGVAGRDWTITPADDSAKAAEVADFIRGTIAAIPNFEHAMAHLLKAIPYGHSVAEVMWVIHPDKVRIDGLRTRRANRFTLLNENRLQLLSADTGQPQDLPERKFICHRHDPQDDVPYATPLLFSLYWPWYFKKHALGFWMLFAEKFAVPSVFGKYPPHFTDADIAQLVQALTNLQQDSVSAIPQDVQIDMGAASVGIQVRGTFFQGLVDFCNAEISKCVLGGTLTQEVGKTGSYAAARTHQEVRQEIVAADSKLLQTTINSTLVRWLVDFNYGPDVPVPNFQIDYLPLRGTPEFAQSLRTLSEMGYKIPTRFIAETFGLPEATEGEEVLQPPTLRTDTRPFAPTPKKEEE